MHTHRPGSLAAAVGLVVAATLLPVTEASAAAPAWHSPPPVPPPSAGANSVLQDVSVRAPTDTWAVGAWWNTTAHPFAVHWNGEAWSTASLPERAQPTYLTGVDALAPDDVWAVGSGETEPGDTTPTTAVILHFDGTAWSTVPTPVAPAGTESDLDDVDMRTAGDGWAVGHTAGNGTIQPLILHWQAGKWISAAVPDLPGTQLTSVFASAADVWAVGTASSGSGDATAVVLHSDGVTWSRVDVPAPAGSSLNSVAGTPGDVWVGGQTCVPLICIPLVLHRTTTGWRTEDTTAGAAVTAIVALPSNIWTFGYTRGLNGGEAGHVERWTGQRFQPDNTVSIPGGGGPQDPRSEIASASPLAGAAGDPATGAVWSVGWAAGPPRSPNVIYWN
jgi:hypothetical protein